MIEMPNDQMIPNNQESSSMDTEVTVAATDSSLMTTITSFPNVTMTPDMIFNEGHQLNIIVYRFVTDTTKARLSTMKLCFYLFTQYFNGYIGDWKHHCISLVN